MPPPMVASENLVNNPASLQQIQQSIAAINTRLDGIAKATGADKKPVPKESNKWIIGGIFALAGWKLVALVLGKVGYIADVSRALVKGGWPEFVEMYTVAFDAILGKPGAKESFVKLHKYAFVGGAVGTVVGPIAGAWLGLARGDRLDNPSDLFTHPIKSMQKIFAKNPPKPEVAATEPIVPVQPTLGMGTSHHVHEGTVAAPEKSRAI